jgi:hypothetical protein
LVLDSHMPIETDKRRIIIRCILRLLRRNSSTFHLVSSAFKGLLNGNLNKQIVSRVFDVDPQSDLPVEDLVAEALLNGLDESDIEEVFRRYARKKGLEF